MSAEPILYEAWQVFALVVMSLVVGGILVYIAYDSTKKEKAAKRHYELIEKIAKKVGIDE